MQRETFKAQGSWDLSGPQAGVAGSTYVCLDSGPWDCFHAFSPHGLLSASRGATGPAAVLGVAVGQMGFYLLLGASGYRSLPGPVTDRRPSSMRMASLRRLPPCDPHPRPHIAHLLGLTQWPPLWH